jgi:hypothetical protein
MKEPKIWESEKYKIHKDYILISFLNAEKNPLAVNQPTFWKIKGNKIINKMHVHLSNVESRIERDESDNHNYGIWGISYFPVGKDKGCCGFGVTFIPADENKRTEWNDILLEKDTFDALVKQDLI